MKSVIAVLFLAVLMCSASTIDCSAGAVDVTTLTAGNGCTIGAFTNDNFQVTTSHQFSSYVVSLLGADLIGNDEVLHFGVTSDPSFIVRSDESDNGSIWVHLTYQVSMPSAWIDSIDLKNVDGSGVVIYEYACAASFADYFGECPAADQLGSIHASSGEFAETSFKPVSKVYLRKDFVYDDASLARFDNSTGAPEPGTELLFGLGLTGVALWSRRRAVYK